MKGTIAIRLDQDLEREFDRACKQTGRSRGLRSKLLPLAEARGYVTDDDVFGDIS